ncbi:unnamed protein product [Lactuca saligna]|uniref:Uncharacterized protein n=1 Tax=Lactuca saligna TaxID=75948 RepID=A0AA35ZRU2_LACSI|nr:unnamed protein product [Lactuca saligna]
MVVAAASLALGIEIEGNKEGWYDCGSIALAVIIFIIVTGLVVVVSLLVILLIRFFTGQTKDDKDQVEFVAGKTSLGDVVDGAIKILLLHYVTIVVVTVPEGLPLAVTLPHDKLQNLGLFFWLEEEKKAQAERDKMLQMQVLHSSFQLLVVLLMMEAANKENGRSRMK